MSEEGEESLVQQHKSASEVAADAAAGLSARLTGAGPESSDSAHFVPAQPAPWSELAAQLPTARELTDDRARLFSQFDINGNGLLSLAEVDKGLLVLLGVDKASTIAVHQCRPATMRAFQAAKDVSGSSSDQANDYVTKSEFRLLLVYVRRYFELLAAFDVIDTGGDRRVDQAEFESALQQLTEWGVVVTDAAAEFAALDANGGGQVLFDEFGEWALRKGLEADGMSEEGEESLVQQHKSASDALSSSPLASAVHRGKPPLKPKRTLPRAGVRHHKVIIEPVPPEPETPYQQYLKTHGRYSAAVVKATPQ